MNADPTRHAFCPACGHMGCAHLAAELEQLRASARRWFLSDGSEVDRDPAEVLRLRREAALEMQQLRDENAALRAALANAGVPR